MHRTTFLILALLFALCVGSEPGLKVAIKESELNLVKDELLPLAWAKLDKITIPDVHTKEDGFDIDVTSIHIHVDALPSSNVHIGLKDNTNVVTLSMSGISLSGSAHAHAKWHFISKSVDMTISVHSVGFHSDIVCSVDSNGRPHVVLSNFHVSLSSNDVDIHFNGGFIEKLLNWIVDLLKGHIVDPIRDAINKQVPDAVDEQVNKILETMPLSVDISDKVAVAYKMAKNPVVHSSYIIWFLSGYMYLRPNGPPPSYGPTPFPDYQTSDPKGVQIIFSDFLLKSGLDVGFQAGTMVFNQTFEISGEKLALACAMKQAPTIEFVEKIVASTKEIDCDMHITDTGSTDLEVTLKAKLDFVVEEYIKTQTVYFKIDDLTFTVISIDGSGVDWFNKYSKQIIDGVVAALNVMYGQKGIKLPDVKGVTYSDVTESVGQHFMTISATPKFDFTS